MNGIDATREDSAIVELENNNNYSKIKRIE